MNTVKVPPYDLKRGDVIAEYPQSRIESIEKGEYQTMVRFQDRARFPFWNNRTVTLYLEEGKTENV